MNAEMKVFRSSLNMSIQKFRKLHQRSLYLPKEGEKREDGFYQAISIQARACWGDMVKELEGLLRQYELFFPQEDDPPDQLSLLEGL